MRLGRLHSFAAGHGDAVAVGCEIVHAHAELERDLGNGHDRFVQHPLQVAAMHEPKRRAKLLRGGGTELGARQISAGSPIQNSQFLGRDFYFIRMCPMNIMLKTVAGIRLI